MAQPTQAQPTGPPSPSGGDVLAGAKRGKREKLEGGMMLLVGRVTRRLVWVFSGLIFAGIAAWGFLEIALFGPSVEIGFAGASGTFTLDRFLVLAAIVALFPPAMMYLSDSRRRDSIDNNIPHLIRDTAYSR